MKAYTCRTCAVQYALTAGVPPRCIICEDDRQYVGVGGQQWTTLAALREEGHRGELHDLEPGLTAVEVTPTLGIGQRALLVQTGNGNLLWDCVGYLDDDLVAAVAERGGIDAIAVSHPHFYGAIVEWSQAFGNAPIYLPTADRQWVVRQDTDVRWWSDEAELPGRTRLLQCGGHFDGSAALHWDGAAGEGVLLVGDTATVVADRRHVSFMRSYPNVVPLPPATVRQIVDVLTRYPAERIYGAWTHREILGGAGEALERSASRYIAWATGQQ